MSNWSTPEAEVAVLGAMLVSEGALATGLELLQPYHFARTSHRAVFEAIAATDSAGLGVDMITVSDHAGPQLDEHGGFKLLSELAAEAIPANIPTLCGIVRRDAINRRIERIGLAIADVARDHLPEEDRDGRIDRLLATMYDTTAEGEEEALQGPLERVLTETRKMSEGQQMGVPTGYVDLDKILGGLQEGQLVTIAARPGMGKTALGLNIAHNVAIRNEGTLVFAIEMPTKEVAARLISRQAKIPLQRMRTDSGSLTDDDWLTMRAAANAIAALPLYVDDRPPYTMASIRARARRAVRTKGIRLIVIDYLQLIGSEQRGENRQVEVAEVSRALKMLARELEVPVAVMAQLSRATEKRDNKRPMLSDLRDSGAIEQDSDVVIFPWREGYYEPAEEESAELIVAKHRQGALGTVYCRWKAATVEFSNNRQRGGTVPLVEKDDIPWGT